MVSAGAQKVRARAARAEEPRAASEERTVRSIVGVGIPIEMQKRVL